ncbi:cysteine desulfurase family protein [Entomospira culicis]|nr:aminotransferase class V-fold PLP-dependent enzyme [Entomospira culicis]WDI37136.1 aminotransferase class V-fold PLP-dependent enzyme [Entomospira culicis]
MLYFDSAATAMLEQIFVEEAYRVALEYFANPSSLHEAGKRARGALSISREAIGRYLGLPADDLIFTSGATEANQLVLLSLLRSPARGTILMSEAEHPSMYENHRWLKQTGFSIKFVKVDKLGRLDLLDLQKLLTKEVRMLCCMAINYQSGAINDISAIRKVLDAYQAEHQSRSIHLHVDAAQLVVGHLYGEVSHWRCDSLALSAHKLGGAKGVGLLYWRGSKQAFLQGGGQEFGMRSGTENLFGVKTLELALHRVSQERDTQAQAKQALFYQAVADAGGVVYHQEATAREKSMYHYLVRFAPLPGEVVVRHLSEHGIMVGTNSACSGGNKERLRALMAQGIAMKEAGEIVRFSYSPWTPISQLEALSVALPQAMAELPR